VAVKAAEMLQKAVKSPHLPTFRGWGRSQSSRSHVDPATFDTFLLVSAADRLEAKASHATKYLAPG
jgi:hypothetical protein